MKLLLMDFLKRTRLPLALSIVWFAAIIWLRLGKEVEIFVPMIVMCGSLALIIAAQTRT